MSGGKAEQIERISDAAAAALWAASAGYLGLRLSSAIVGAVAAAISFFCCFALLRSVRPEEQHFSLSDYILNDMPPPAVPQFLLTQDHEVQRPHREAPELLLEDVLAELAPDSRVVRLFDAAAMPTPGELRARIDRHLDIGRASAAPPDASQALHEALAELRRSIR